MNGSESLAIVYNSVRSGIKRIAPVATVGSHGSLRLKHQRKAVHSVLFITGNDRELMCRDLKRAWLCARVQAKLEQGTVVLVVLRHRSEVKQTRCG